MWVCVPHPVLGSTVLGPTVPDKRVSLLGPVLAVSQLGLWVVSVAVK